MSGSDWDLLAEIFRPYIHAEEPTILPWIEPPEHLREHPLIVAIRTWRETRDNRFLDEAGRYHCPCNKPFGWYLPLTK